jgi:acyl-CoA reductase-like NAD-dependent aldehyde dehydrogenase
MSSRLSQAQDAFFEAFASMSQWDRGELLNRLEMALDDEKQELENRFLERGKANVLLNRFDDLSYAITAQDGEEE